MYIVTIVRYTVTRYGSKIRLHMTQVAQEFICEYCGTTFYSKWGGAKYCSQACKQTAYRRRIKPESGDHDTVYERMVETKREQARGKTCPECGKYFIVDGFHTAKELCSRACIQRRYRRRKAWYSQDDKPQAIIKKPEIDPNIALNQQLQRAYDMQTLQEEFDSKRE